MTATATIAGNPAFETLTKSGTWFRKIWKRHTRKHVALAFDVPWGTARDWVENRSSPRVDQVLEAAARDATLLAEFQKVLGEISLAQRRLEETAGQGVLALGDVVGSAGGMAQPASRPAQSPAARADAIRRAA